LIRPRAMPAFPRNTDAKARKPVTVSQSRQPTNLPVSLPSSWSADKAAQVKALQEEALEMARRAAAGGTIGVDFSGSSTTAGGKITTKNIATKKFTEETYNSVVLADNITAVQNAPSIDVKHEKVCSTALENINSHYLATQNVTITQTNTSAVAGGDLEIYQEGRTLVLTETNVINHARKDQNITRNANEINRVVNGRQVHEATTNDNRQGRM